jgi:mannose-6-phosphate isomerase-like protein (cupin superfamily)
MSKSFRRVVTGHNGEGQSVFVMDADAPHVHAAGGPGRAGVRVTELWETRSTPADNASAGDPTDRPFNIHPPAGGSVFRIVEYPPDSALDEKPGDRFRALGASDVAASMGGRHAGFHKTATVDYVVVLSGEIFALMDEGEVRLQAGDVLVQRGTNHAWSNRTGEPAYLAFVLITARPVPEE